MKKRFLCFMQSIVLLVMNVLNIAPVSVIASVNTAIDMSENVNVYNSTDLIDSLKNGKNIVLQQDITTDELTVEYDSYIDLNGYKLVANGIVIEKLKTLTIMDSKYTDDNQGSGKLISTGKNNKAGIQTTDATLIIESGVIEATGDDFGAGIGGSKGDSNCAGKLIINAGVVNATGGKSACGIGGGADFRTEKRGGKVGVVTINGGTVIANGGVLGIGGGDGYRVCEGGGQVTINSGRIITKGLVVIGGELNVNGGTVETLELSVINATIVSFKNCTVLGQNSYAGIYDGAGNRIKEKYKISVTSSLGGTTLGGGIIECDTTVELCATPDIGYIFDGWYENGEKISGNKRYSFVVTSNRDLEARFAKIVLDSIVIDGEKQLEDMLIVECDKTLDLTVLPNPNNAVIDKNQVVWSTSDSTIAKVENGIVTGVKQGQVTISASFKGEQASCIITVIPDLTITCDECLGIGYEYIRCEECSYDGKMSCPICKGKGTTSVFEKCSKCNGEGKFFYIRTCVICNGSGLTYNTATGYVECSNCIEGKEWIWQSCSCIDGKTEIEYGCEYCEGYGKIICKYCNGEKNYDKECEKCKSTGKLEKGIYKISYNANGGTNSPYAQVKIENIELQISNQIPIRENYIFLGWAVESSAIEVDYLPGEYITSNESKVLYAVWEEKITLASIGVTQMPFKVNYTEGEIFETLGLIITAYYSNGTTKVITDYEITGYDSSPGEKCIKVTYNDKTVDFTITVKSKITLTSISIAQMPYKVSYTEGEKFDSTGLIVTAHYSNNTTQNITNYGITGYESTPGQKKIKISYDNKTVEFNVTVKLKVPQVITSKSYKVSNTVISKVAIGTSVKKLVGAINENKYVKVFKNQTEIKPDEIVGTGMTVKIMDGNTVVKSYKIIVTGDVNGDGNASVTDMLAIKAHILGKNKLSGEYATAADTSGDNSISITDFIQVKAKVLGKGNITAR